MKFTITNRRVAIKSAVFAIGTAVIAGILAWSFESGFLRFNYPSRSKYPIQGIDISHHQGHIDWDILKQQDVQFIYMKATEGQDWVDPKFAVFWQSATARGLLVGAYHFYRICKNGEEQARNFIATVPKSETSMPHVIDLEDMSSCIPSRSKDQIINEVAIYISRIQEHYGKPPIIYATEEFYRAYLANQFKGNRIWIRNIFWEPGLSNERQWVLWQYTNRGRIRGVENNVDLNVFFGGKAQFEQFLIEQRL